jgi:hypothetical protein
LWHIAKTEGPQGPQLTFSEPPLNGLPATTNASVTPNIVNPLVLPVFWRLVIAANDEDENLMVLPPLDTSIQDKLMIFDCEKHPLPMPSANLEQRKALEHAIRQELPAFCHFLLEWKIPAELVGQRFGVKEYHHPRVTQIMHELSPEHRLLQLMAGALFRSVSSAKWAGSILEFEKELTDDSSPMRHEARKLFTHSRSALTYLQRLHRRYPDHIKNEHGMHGGHWYIDQKITEVFKG